MQCRVHLSTFTKLSFWTPPGRHRDCTVYCDTCSGALYGKHKHPLMAVRLLLAACHVPLLCYAHVQMRKPLDLWSMIKSPYGLMLGFMLFGIFVFPMLKVDPDEYREAMAQLRDATGGQQQQQPQQQRLRDR